MGLALDHQSADSSALRAHKIEIPYPQRVMHMVGSAKPGEA
jgi:small-conductance mechanosensitive channel